MLGFFLPLAIAIAALVLGNKRMEERLERLCKYSQCLEGQDSRPIKALAAAVGKEEDAVTEELDRMLKKGWFPDGRVDRQGGCFWATNAAYERQRLGRAEQRQIPSDDGEAGEVAQAIRQGRGCMELIRRARDTIECEAVSKKLGRLERTADRIFSYVGEHPHKLPALRNFTGFYLPSALKLANAYREFDQRAVQSPKITKAKEEITETLDTLDAAFEKLFDQLFEDNVMDISTDISVLKTLLAQESLTVGDFERREE